MKNLDFDRQTNEFMLYCRTIQLREKSMKSYESSLRLLEMWLCFVDRLLRHRKPLFTVDPGFFLDYNGINYKPIHQKGRDIMAGTVKIIKQSITTLDVDCIVNAANEELRAGGGVCGAIFSAAGYTKLQHACNQIGHCPTGSAVITGGFQSRAKYIIHAVGPRYQDGWHGEPMLLCSAYQKSLDLAVHYGCRSIAFPLISTGIFGYPVKKAWHDALSACKEFFDAYPEISLEVTFAVLDDEILKLGNEALIQIMPGMKVAEKSDWNTVDMPAQHAVFSFQRHFTEAQMKTLRHGFIPLEMEDKWFRYMEENTLFIHRSWTGYCIYKITFSPSGIHTVVANRDPEQYSCASIAQDVERLNELMDSWALPYHSPHDQRWTDFFNSPDTHGMIKSYLTIGGRNVEAVFFHRPEDPYGFLSNWYPSCFTLDGIRFSSAGQYILYQKCVMFGDTFAAKRILDTDDPNMQQAIGDAPTGYLDSVWAGMRQAVAMRGLHAKFSQNAELKEKLLSTSEAILVACAQTEKNWSCGIGLKDSLRFDAKNWSGKNLLGFALMEVRSQLK